MAHLIGCHSNQDLKAKSSLVSYRHKERKRDSKFLYDDLWRGKFVI